MWHHNRWPSHVDIDRLQREEDDRADRQGDQPDPICDCGCPGYACRCEEIACAEGQWSDGTTYGEEDPICVDEPSWLEDDDRRVY
jgi:hypothetical protein